MPSLRVWRVQKTITRARRIGTAPSGATASLHSGEIPAIKIGFVVSFQCVYSSNNLQLHKLPHTVNAR